MQTNYHFSCIYKTMGTKLNDGTGCVMLALADKKTGATELYPLHLDDARNIAKDLLKMVMKVKIFKRGS